MTNSKHNVAEPAIPVKPEAAAKGTHTATDPAHKTGHAASEATHKAKDHEHPVEKAHAKDAPTPSEKPKK